MPNSELPKLILDKNNLPEFIGRIIDTIEDFCDEHQIIWPSEDRDLEIKSLRKDYPDKTKHMTDAEIASEEGLAIIYGEDYDTIASSVEGYFTEKLENESVIKKISKTDANILVDETLDEFSTFLTHPDMEKAYNENKQSLKDELLETFHLWDLID